MSNARGPVHENTHAVLERNFRAALRGRDHDSAAQVLDQLQALDPLGPVTRVCEVELALATDRIADASALVDAMVELHPTSARVRFLAGKVAAKQRDWSAAASHFHESHELAPHDATRREWARALTNLGDFDRSEALLVDLQTRIPSCALDLAWLDERRGQPARGLTRVEEFLRTHPHDARAIKQRNQLRAKLLDRPDVNEEVETLDALGEAIDVATLERFTEVGLRGGEHERVRALLESRLPAMSVADAFRLGWVAYKADAWDLAADLFLKALPHRVTDVRLLSALEKAARHGGRIPELRAAYEALAPRHKNLYGRLRDLKPRS